MLKEKKMAKLKINDAVLWKGSWGKDNSQIAKVTGISKTKSPNEKEGVSVEDIDWNDNFVVDLDNGHWAYKYQIKATEKK